MIKNLLGHWFRRFSRHIDQTLFGLLLLAILIGLFILYSASGQNAEQVGRQGLSLLIALACMGLFANISPQRLEAVAVPLYISGLLLSSSL